MSRVKAWWQRLWHKPETEWSKFHRSGIVIHDDNTMELVLNGVSIVQEIRRKT